MMGDSFSIWDWACTIFSHCIMQVHKQSLGFGLQDILFLPSSTLRWYFICSFSNPRCASRNFYGKLVIKSTLPIRFDRGLTFRPAMILPICCLLTHKEFYPGYLPPYLHSEGSIAITPRSSVIVPVVNSSSLYSSCKSPLTIILFL